MGSLPDSGKGPARTTSLGVIVRAVFVWSTLIREVLVEAHALFQRYKRLQDYIGWGPADVERIHAVGPLLRPSFPALVDEFHDTIRRHAEVAWILEGGDAQITRLKRALGTWLEDLFFCARDEDYVLRRWNVGLRHVQIGLDQIYVNAAMTRIRSGLLQAHAIRCTGTIEELLETRFSINRLLDLDLALIQDAYQTEFLAWQNREEREKLLRAERLAAIGETMAGLVHESRNALQRTSACLEMLALDISDRPKSLDLLRRIQIAQNDLHRLFEEVREYAAPLTLQRTRCNVANIWRQAWSELAHVHGPKQLRLVETSNGQPPYSFVDRFALTQVFRNILENAIEASPFGEQVTIACDKRPADQGGGLDILVRDCGSGIPHEVRPRVFQPFFTTKTKGTGLGLAITRRIVDGHGGQIEVGAPPRGAEVRIYLPQAQWINPP